MSATPLTAALFAVRPAPGPKPRPHTPAPNPSPHFKHFKPQTPR